MHGYRLLNKGGFQKYVGVDPELPERNRFGDYCRYKEEGFLSNAPVLDEAQFHALIQMHRTTAQDFLQWDRGGYNLVVLSDLLHLRVVRENWIEILSQSLDKLESGGYAYIKVITEDHPNWTEQLPFLNEQIDQLAQLAQIKWTGKDLGDPRKKIFIATTG